MTATRDILLVDQRWATLKDIPAFLSIEQSTAHPWNEAHFRAAYADRDTISRVAEASGRVVGFAVYRVKTVSLSVLNMVVAPEVRRRRVGTQLVGTLVDQLTKQRRVIYVNVRESNLGAQLFLRENGFKYERTMIPGTFEDPDEDGYEFARRYDRRD